MELKDIAPSAIIIITVIIIGFIGATILTSIYKDQVDTVSVVNETITGSSSSYVPLTYTLISVSDVWGYNGTAWNQLASPADYNATAGNLETGEKGGVIVSSTYNSQSVNVSYSGYADNYASNISKSGISAQTEIANWTPTIALIIIAAIIIGIIVSSFVAFRRRR